METITKDDVNLVKERLNLTPTSKILNVSHHGCMDGSGSSIPIYNNFDKAFYIRAKYDKIDEIANDIDYDKYDAVIFTDISPSKVSLLEGIKNVVIIDHHKTATHNHNPDNMRFVYQGESASFQTQKFFSYYFSKDQSYLDELFKHINDYDMWINPIGKSWQLSLLHYYYLKKDNFQHKDFIKRFCTGDVRFKPDEAEYIEKQEKILKTRWNEIHKGECFNLPNDINGCLIRENNYVNELLHRVMDELGYKIAINQNPNTFQCSVRCGLESVPVGDILQEIGIGGGHNDAGGFHNETIVDFKLSLVKLCKHLYDNYKELRM